jgi:prolyl-tRNA synthetase
VPLRIAIGQSDLENGTVELARRDTLTKVVVEMTDLVSTVESLLKTIQEELFNKARNYRDNHITEVNDFESFKTVLENKAGFISAHWDGTAETEQKIKELTKATIRCIPIDVKKEVGKCVYTGKPSANRVLFAKAY